MCPLPRIKSVGPSRFFRPRLAGCICTAVTDLTRILGKTKEKLGGFYPHLLLLPLRRKNIHSKSSTEAAGSTANCTCVAERVKAKRGEKGGGDCHKTPLLILGILIHLPTGLSFSSPLGPTNPSFPSSQQQSEGRKDTQHMKMRGARIGKGQTKPPKN